MEECAVWDAQCYVCNATVDVLIVHVEQRHFRGNSTPTLLAGGVTNSLAKEVRARAVPSNFATEPVPAWDTAFSLWGGDSKVQLTAVVDNRVFPGDWQRPAITGVTVSHQTVAIKTTCGVYHRLAKSLTNEIREMVQTKIGSPDCIAIGECGLDYTELQSQILL